jgi:succinate dehydrogenase/fumarate reductase flavoprotein subunit
MPNSTRRTFLKNVGQGTLAAGMGIGLPEGAWLQANDAEGAFHAEGTGNDNSVRENRIECDVLVIGGGIAGCFAALKARGEGAEVILVDKGFVGKSGQTPFASSFVAFNPEWGHKLDTWMNFLNGVSEYVNNRYWTEKVLLDSYAIYQDLVSWGVEFRKDKDGKVLRAPVTAGVTEQILFSHSARNSGPSTQNHAQVLRRQVLKSGIKILDRVMVPELLKQNGRIVGAVGIPMDSFDLYSFIAKTTILCVGGCSFKPLGYPPLVPLTCDGEGMAYRAGAEIIGKEFIATNYTCVDAPSIIGRRGLPEDLDQFLGMEKLPPGQGLFERRVNAEGHDIPERPVGTTEYKFAYLEADFEAHAGRAPIYWRTVSGDRELTGGAALGMSLRKADGLWPANNSCASSLPGLYAAGDALGTMQNGAVYNLRGACTAGCAVTGTIAGIAAAREALKMGKLVVDEKEIARAKQVVHIPKERRGGYSPRWVTHLLKNTMSPYFISHIKKADRLQATLTLVEFMQEHLVPSLIARDAHELRLAHETKNMVLSAEMRLRSALFRTESRGNHYREDYPRRDDPNWLAWSKIKQEQGKMKLVKVPMPKEWWPDLSKPYRQRYPFRFPGE